MTASRFVIRGHDGVDISAVGMRDWDALVLQKAGQWDVEPTEPLVFCRVAMVPDDKCLDFIEQLWYTAINYEKNGEGQYSISKWKAQEETTNSPQQVFNAPVGNVAGRDIIINNSIEASQVVNLLIQAIERSQEIPDEEKRSLLDKLKGLLSNRFITGISSGLVTELIKGLL